MSDFVNGPGRGSACGSLVAYLLGIIEIDPVEHDLIFERFLNLKRRGLPDIDIDVSHTSRSKILKYVSTKYNNDSVVQIISFGTFRAKTSLRDAARYLNVKGRKVDELVKKIGRDDFLKKCNPTTRDPYIGNLLDDELIEVVKIAKQLLGRVKNISVHAAGIVIIPDVLKTFIPIFKKEEQPLPISIFDMNDLSKLGLVKFDILSVKTLTTINDTIKRTKSNLNFRELAFNYNGVYREIGDGNSFGIFQLESAGMTKFMKKLNPSNFGELIDGISLYRPGPMSSGMLDSYLKKEKMKLPEIVLSILSKTRGVLIFQEQVMEIAKKVGNYTMEEADELRIAMSKKKHYLIEKSRDQFIDGAGKNKIPRDEAENIFDMMTKFGEYCFNKSHAAAYAELSYLTAYLKIKFPSYYLSNLLTYEVGNLDRIEKGIREAARLGVKIKPPDINGPLRNFKATKTSITFPLSAIRGIGEQHLLEFEQLRNEKKKIESIEDFLSLSRKYKRIWEAINILLKAGALDSFGYTRRGLSLLIFGGISIEAIEEIEEFNEEILFSDEKEMIGVAIPRIAEKKYFLTLKYCGVLDNYKDIIEEKKEEFLIYGKFRKKSKELIEFISSEGNFEINGIFDFAIDKSIFYIVLIEKQTERNICKRIKKIEDIAYYLSLYITIKGNEQELKVLITPLFNTLKEHNGPGKLVIDFVNEDGQTIKINSGMNVLPDEILLSKLQAFSDNIDISLTIDN